MSNQIIKTDGTIVEAIPKDGKKFSLEELQGAVGGLIQLFTLRDGRDMWCNDEGKLDGLPANLLATAMWIDTYGPYDVIVGDVIVTDRASTQGDEDEGGEA
jgi:hypothetical protein